MKTFKIFNKRKNKKYQFTQKCQKQDKRHLPKFLPLTIQFFKKDDELYKKRLSAILSKKWKSSYSKTIRLIPTWLQIWFLTSARLCLRGCRTKWRGTGAEIPAAIPPTDKSSCSVSWGSLNHMMMFFLSGEKKIRVYLIWINEVAGTCSSQRSVGLVSLFVSLNFRKCSGCILYAHKHKWKQRWHIQLYLYMLQMHFEQTQKQDKTVSFPYLTVLSL